MVELSNEPNSDEIPVNVVSNNEEETNSSTMESKSLESTIDELNTQLELEKQRSSEYEEKLKLVLADFQNLTSRLRDYVGDVEAYEDPNFDLFHSDKTTIVVACSKSDFDNIEKTKQDSDLIIVKANPLCETINNSIN